MSRIGLQGQIGLISVLIGLVMPGVSHAESNCLPIRFDPGRSSATIHGMAPPDTATCYSFTAAANQTASLEIAGNNMMISVIGLGDDRLSWTFKTEAKTYNFIVGQQFRSVTTEPYTVTLSIR
jgi:hypothetical protein